MRYAMRMRTMAGELHIFCFEVALVFRMLSVTALIVVFGMSEGFSGTDFPICHLSNESEQDKEIKDFFEKIEKEVQEDTENHIFTCRADGGVDCRIVEENGEAENPTENDNQLSKAQSAKEERVREILGKGSIEVKNPLGSILMKRNNEAISISVNAEERTVDLYNSTTKKLETRPLPENFKLDLDSATLKGGKLISGDQELDLVDYFDSDQSPTDSPLPYFPPHRGSRHQILPNPEDEEDALLFYDPKKQHIKKFIKSE